MKAFGGSGKRSKERKESRQVNVSHITRRAAPEGRCTENSASQPSGCGSERGFYTRSLMAVCNSSI